MFEFLVTAQIEGFAGTLKLTADTGAELVRMVKGLQQAHILPAAAPATPSSAPSTAAPICKHHGAMKPSKYGGWHCTARVGDGSYCTEKVS